MLSAVSERVATWMHPRIDVWAGGEIWAVTLDRMCAAVGAYRLTRTHLVSIPLILKQILRLSDVDGACRMILVHKDIGGGEVLSGEGLALTADLCALCRPVGVEIVDLLVFDARARYMSLRKRGFFDTHRWHWKRLFYPTMKELSSQRAHHERMVRARLRAASSRKKKGLPPPPPPAAPPVSEQAASWVRPLLDVSRRDDLWIVMLDQEGIICGAFRAGNAGDPKSRALLAAILVRTQHLDSSRVIVVQGHTSAAPCTDGARHWVHDISQAAPWIGLEIADLLIVAPAGDDHPVSR